MKYYKVLRWSQFRRYIFRIALRSVLVRFSFGSRSILVHPPFILRSRIEDLSKNERRIIGGKTEMCRNSSEKPRERRFEQKLYF